MSKVKMILTQQDDTINMKRKLSVIIISNIIMICCNGQSENNSKNTFITPQNESMDSKTEIALKKQLEEGAYQFAPDGSDVGKPSFDSEEMRAMVNVEEDFLKQKGYQFPDNVKFGDKIKLFFDRQIISNSDKEYLYINLKDKCDHNFVNFKSDGIYYNGFYIIKKKNFITDFYYLPEVLNYEKIYDKLYNAEKTANSVIYNTRYNVKVEIQKWREVEDLEEQRFYNIQTIAARNKYLFNDSKADLVWLKANDKVFLESLVKTFGYTSDLDLLDFVVKNNYKDKMNIRSILWNESCAGKIKVNKEVFDIVKKWDDKDFQLFSGKVQDVLVDLYKEIKLDESVSFSERTKIMGLIAYHATKANQKFYYRFFPLLNDPDFDVEFKKANYYNISDFKEIYEDTRFGGIGQAE